MSASAPTVLVAAKRLSPDGSSEGICSAKFIKALSDNGTELEVLCSDEATTAEALSRTLPWLPANLTVFRSVAERALDQGGAPRLRSAVNLAASSVGGYPLWYRRSTSRWRRVLGQAVRTARPDVVVTRAAGGGFEPHLAMVELDLDIAWIAHYHDPWPATLFPPPYRAESTRPLRLQERDHRRILERADALTFPSSRLRDWVLAPHPDLCSKAYVVPHAIGEITTSAPLLDPEVAGVPSRPFTLVHTGTLLKHRRVEPLLDALERFLAEDVDREASSRLVLAGPIAGGRPSDGPDIGRIESLEARGVVRLVPRRLPYGSALALAAACTAAVLIEAAGECSPFFPAKLTDYLGFDKPVLALTPAQSVASDLMGVAHPLRVDPDDVDAIHRGLVCLWDAHRAGRLSSLRLPADRVAPLGMAAVAESFDRIVEAVTTSSPTQ